MKEEIIKYLAQLKEILKNYQRPKPKREFDQFYATEETLIKRALLIKKFYKKVNGEILFLGDDDLTSIATSLILNSPPIAVVDIDKEILDLIDKISKDYNFNIQTIQYDLRNPLPKNKFYNFNLIFFDPPYTPLGIFVWLNRALEASMGKGRNKKRKSPDFLKNKYYFLCYSYGERSLERGLEIQRIITQLGLIIETKLKNFNKYYNARPSDLYILKPTPKIDLRKIDMKRKAFYTFERG